MDLGFSKAGGESSMRHWYCVETFTSALIWSRWYDLYVWQYINFPGTYDAMACTIAIDMRLARG